MDETFCYDLGSSENSEKRYTLKYLTDEQFRKTCDEFGQDIIIKEIPISADGGVQDKEKPNYFLIGSLGKKQKHNSNVLIISILFRFHWTIDYRCLHCLVCQQEEEGEKDKKSGNLQTCAGKGQCG